MLSPFSEKPRENRKGETVKEGWTGINLDDGKEQHSEKLRGSLNVGVNLSVKH